LAGEDKVKKVEELEDEDGITVKVSKKEENDDDFETVEDTNSTDTRQYDLTITYDLYYTTPRLWLAGYDGESQPLSDKAMFEDIVDDYANKTVTYEAHPCLGVNQMSIHPCKHANVMKHLIDVAADNGSKIESY
jgi:ubiquitin-like-conjugating enzyme ATG3